MSYRVVMLVLTMFAAGPSAPAAGDGRENPEQIEQDEEPRPSELEEHVKVREEAHHNDDPAAFRTRIDGDELDSRARDLADVLRRVPGARVRDYGGLGSYATISVRASTAEQVTVLVDGVPQNRALGGPVDLSAIPATQIDTIDVFRGFAPASLGQGAIGGVVDVRTKPPGSDPGAQVDLLVGELDTARASAALSIPTGRASGLRIDAEALTGNGDFTFLDTGGTFFDTSDDKLRRRRNNALDQQAILLQHAWEEVGPHRLRLSLRFHDRERGVPWIDNLPTGTVRYDDRLADFTASWNRSAVSQDDPHPQSQLRFSESQVVLNAFDQEIRFDDSDGDFGVATDRTTDMDGIGVSGVLRGSGGRHRIALRGDARFESADVRDDRLSLAPDRGGAERTKLGITVEDTFRVGPVVLAPSVRWDRRDDEFVPGAGGTIPPPADDIMEDAWSGKLGVAWAVTSQTTLRGSVGSFFRSPSLLEMFGNRGSLRGNPGLKAERGTAAELGVVLERSWRGAGGRVELVGFARRTDDMIHFRQQSQGVAVAVNLLETEVYGVESMTGVTLPWGFVVDVSATWQRAVDRSGSPFDGEPLIFHPDWLGYAGIAWSYDGWHADWELTYTGENSIDEFDVPELRLDERVMHDFTAGHEWQGGFRVSLDLRNVFDRRTVDVSRYPLPDRAVFLHVGWHDGEAKR